ncbi:MAG: phycobilisome rod-core linker polypeptide, partial [Cyanobacteria bacterium J06648_11]
MAIGVASALGIARFEETEPIELWPHSSESDREIVIQAVYRQVLGNAYVMESERLTVPESQLKNGEIGVREFIRQVAYSDLYRSRFFENCPRYRAIELNFKHLLGRAPVSYEEMQYHSGLLDNHGYNAEIGAILDSEEYQRMFGSTIVPYYRGYKTEAGQPAIAFSHTFKLMRGASSSDKSNYRSGQAPQLNSHVIRHQPAFVATHAAGFTQQRPRGFLDTALGGQLAYSQEGSGYNATDTFSRLGTGYFEDTGAIEIRPGSTAEDYETAIQAVYRQVLGNAYVMESER